MAAEKEEESKQSNQSGVSDEEVRQQSSKVAKQATEAHDKATELMQAAAAAGDPEERQKLMEQALEQQIQSGSLGKTAKYLRSGTFQGMAVGAGLGIAPGASLGTITGTLVGGVSSTALGGLGAGLGAITGWAHGPFLDISKGAGKGIQKITGNIPGWKATESQKKQLEKMIGQINEQEAPGKDELESWGSESVSADQKETLEKAQSKLPSMSSTGSPPKPSGEETSQRKEDKECNRGPNNSVPPDSSTARDDSQLVERKEAKDEPHPTEGTPKQDSQAASSNSAAGGKAESQENGSTYKDAGVQTGEISRKKPRKLRMSSEHGNEPPSQSSISRRQPRKLEKRST